MSQRVALRMVHTRPEVPPTPPMDRGRLMDAAEVATEIYCGKVSAQWVTRHVKAGKVKLGHVKRGWWEYNVRRWLEQRTTEVA